MTGDTPQESGHTSGAESAEIQNPDPDDSPGYGTAAGEEKTVVADSGTASAWPPWLGAARPAGWFLSASGEAAPPETPGTEPARADAAQSAGPSPADQPGRAGTSERAGVFAPTGPSKLTGVPERGEPDPDERPGQPSADGWAEYPPAQDEAVPAEWTGRDDAAAPYAVADSGPDDGWYEDPQPTSVTPDPAALVMAARAAGRAAGRTLAGRAQGRPAARQATGTSRATKPGRTSGDTSRSAPGRRSRHGKERRPGEPWGPALGQPRAYGTPPREPRFVPVVGPTAALRGQAGGPGFVVPPGAVSGLYDPARRSGWQLAVGVWDESGISWEPPVAAPLPEPGWSEHGRSGGPRSQSRAADDYRQDGEPPRGGPGFAGAPAFSAAPAFAGAANFAGAPTFADAPAAARAARAARSRLRCPASGGMTSPRTAPVSRTSCTGPGRARSAGRGDRLRRRGSRRDDGGVTPPGRGRWIQVGVPVAVVVVVERAGAVMEMLTDERDEVLARARTTVHAGCGERCRGVRRVPLPARDDDDDGFGSRQRATSGSRSAPPRAVPRAVGARRRQGC